eukprot:Tamp_30279.p1 GENE.Tamp_30279~~Tamp_30279.p1  ORF type:complete len:220 (-),score=13.20 Tamp_30279:66-725(-)
MRITASSISSSPRAMRHTASERGSKAKKDLITWSCVPRGAGQSRCSTTTVVIAAHMPCSNRCFASGDQLSFSFAVFSLFFLPSLSRVSASLSKLRSLFPLSLSLSLFARALSLSGGGKAARRQCRRLDTRVRLQTGERAAGAQAGTARAFIATFYWHGRAYSHARARTHTHTHQLQQFKYCQLLLAAPALLGPFPLLYTVRPSRRTRRHVDRGQRHGET